MTLHADGNALTEGCAAVAWSDALFNTTLTALSRSSARPDRVPDEAALTSLGGRLYRTLFPDGVHKVFTQLLEEAKAQRRPLDLLLQISDPRLLNLPLELLFHPTEGFLATHPLLTLCRCPLDAHDAHKGLGYDDASRIAHHAPLPPPPLRILMLVSSPDDLPTQRVLDYEREQELMLKALDPLLQQGKAVLEIPDEGSLSTLREYLDKDAYHVLHLSGHASFVEGRGASFQLEDRDGQGESVGAEELARLLMNYPSLRLVFLSGCETARTSDYNAYAGLAQHLLACGVPMVVGMQHKVSDDAARKLAFAFYQGLTLPRCGVAAALTRARLALKESEKQSAEWATPALYSREGAGGLVDWNQPPLPLRRPDAPLVFWGNVVFRPEGFVGRRQETRTIKRLVREGAPALLLHGFGGLGKSTLASRIADKLRREEGALVVPLKGALSVDTLILGIAQQISLAAPSDDNEIAQIASILRHPEMTSEFKLQVIAAHLLRRRFLLLLDNFEDNLNTAGLAPSSKPESSQTELAATRLSSEMRPSPESSLEEGTAPPQSQPHKSGALPPSKPESNVGSESSLEEGASPARGVNSQSAIRNPQLVDPSLAAALVTLIRGCRDMRSQGGRSCVLITSRYRFALPDLSAEELVACSLDDLGLAATLKKMQRHETLRALPLDTKQRVYQRLGGRPRSLESLAAALSLQQVTWESVEPKLIGVEEEARDDVLLQELWNHLTERQRRLLHAASVYRLPVDVDGLRFPMDGADITGDAQTLVDWSLMHAGPMDGLPHYFVHRVVAEFCRREQMSTSEQRAAHCAAGRYFEHRVHRTRSLNDYLEAHHHFLSGREWRRAADIAFGLTEPLMQWGFTEEARRLNQATLDNPPDERSRAVASAQLGDALMAMGQGAEAKRMYEQSLAIAERLLSAEPHRADLARDVSVSYERLGDVLTAEGNLAEARRVYEQSLAIFERLLSAEPHRADLARDIAVSCDRLARVSGELDTEAGRNWFCRGREVLRQLREGGRLPDREIAKYLEWLEKVLP